MRASQRKQFPWPCLKMVNRNLTRNATRLYTELWGVCPKSQKLLNAAGNDQRHGSNKLKTLYYTYVVNAVDERIITAVAHSQPIATEPDDVNIPVPARNQQN